MRDRGITKPGLKAATAAALTIAGAVAAIWGAQNLPLSPDQPSAARVARNLGMVALVVGGLATANYLYALFLVRVPPLAVGRGVPTRGEMAVSGRSASRLICFEPAIHVHGCISGGFPTRLDR